MSWARGRTPASQAPPANQTQPPAKTSRTSRSLPQPNAGAKPRHECFWHPPVRLPASYTQGHKGARSAQQPMHRQTQRDKPLRGRRRHRYSHLHGKSSAMQTPQVHSHRVKIEREGSWGAERTVRVPMLYGVSVACVRCEMSRCAKSVTRQQRQRGTRDSGVV